MIEHDEQPAAERRSTAERLVSVGVELATLALVWRALEDPDPRDLARSVWDTCRGYVDARLLYRRQMFATLEQVRNLPETEGNP